MSKCFTWFPIGVLGEPNIYQNLMWITMCGGFYDIVVIFDLVVFWLVFVLEGGYCFVLFPFTNFYLMFPFL